MYSPSSHSHLLLYLIFLRQPFPLVFKRGGGLFLTIDL